MDQWRCLLAFTSSEKQTNLDFNKSNLLSIVFNLQIIKVDWALLIHGDLMYFALDQ